MSPEGRIVADVMAGAVRRSRLLVLAEALAWGAVAAAITPAAGAFIAVAVAVWRWRSVASRAAIVRTLERAHPEARNLFVTADELSDGRLIVKPVIRQRVLADAAASARRLDLRTIFPIARLVPVVLLACVAWLMAQTVDVWRGALSRVRSGALTKSQTLDGSTSSPASMRVSIAIQPPAYTGLETRTVVDPQQVEAVEGSTLIVTVASPAGRVTMEHDGVVRALVRDPGGGFADRVQATKTGYLLVIADEASVQGRAPERLALQRTREANGARGFQPSGEPAGSGHAGTRRMIPLVVSPDALPAVRVTAPGRDLVYAGGNPRIAFEAQATDDFGLRSLALRYTKVSGSGEQFEFQDGEIPLTVASASAREWTGRSTRSLEDLRLKDGDILVYRAVAADARPGDGSASSDAFFIEISKLGVAAGDAFTLPEEETRYALSQQMLIIRTERLHQRRASMTRSDLTAAALNLAVEQRMVRAELVFMLGGEVENEEVEAKQSTELQEGRLQNRGQRDLRAATIAMSRAERQLTGANTGDALTAERTAVAALQRAFSRDRYILRALATRSRLDPARRLTGNLSEAIGSRRHPLGVAANRRAAVLQDLLSGIAGLLQVSSDEPAPTPGAFRQRALVIAGEAVRIDPAAALLRQAATELQRAADAAGDPAARFRALTTAAAAASSEARRAHADPALPSTAIAPALSGAFSDALYARLPPSRLRRFGEPRPSSRVPRASGGGKGSRSNSQHDGARGVQPSGGSRSNGARGVQPSGRPR